MEKAQRVGVTILAGTVVCGVVNYLIHRSTGRKSRSEAVSRWAAADAVCFEIDRTVCKEDSVDAMVKLAEVELDDARMTGEGSSGEGMLSGYLTACIERNRPSKSTLDRCVDTHPLTLTPGVSSLIAALLARNVPVYLVAGGLLDTVEPIAAELDIPSDHVFAHRAIVEQADRRVHTVRFGDDNPRGRAGVIKSLVDVRGCKRPVLVASGMGSAELRPANCLFVGYGGHTVDERVKASADMFVTDFEALLAAISPEPTFLESYMRPTPASPRWSGKWWWDNVLVFAVYAVTGSATAAVTRPLVTQALGLRGSMRDGPWSYRIISVLATMPCYIALLLVVGTLFGRHALFRARAKRMISRFLPSTYLKRRRVKDREAAV